VLADTNRAMLTSVAAAARPGIRRQHPYVQADAEAPFTLTPLIASYRFRTTQRADKLRASNPCRVLKPGGRLLILRPHAPPPGPETYDIFIQVCILEFVAEMRRATGTRRSYAAPIRILKA
jgi:ubiquinone/menaquinone biosynthesis C-methylase UbiE